MSILIIDTTKQTAFVCAKINNQEFYRVMPKTEKHSEALLNEIETLLNDANVKLSDFNAFGVVCGPGSFTGIRIGISTVKAFNIVLNNKIVSANVFDVLSNCICNGVYLTRNTNSSYYYAKYNNNEIIEKGLVDKCDILNKFSNLDIYVLECEQFDDLNSYNNINIITDYKTILLNFFVAKLEKNETININDLEPFYMQLSQAERDLINKDDTKINK